LKKNGGGARPVSDSLSGQEGSLGEGAAAKDEDDAFWGLVRLFITCHRSENKDYQEGVVKQMAPALAQAASSEITAGIIKGTK